MPPIEYDSVDFDPPAPVMDISISVPGSRNEQSAVRMLLDLGADMTCLPQDLVKALGSLRSDTIAVYGYSRRPTIRKTSYVNFTVADQEFEDVEVLPIESDYGLLGRDVLNQLILRLDGPKCLWSILEA